MNSRGHSLAEAIVALALLSIALAGILPAFQVFIDANTFSEEHSNAVAAAQQIMEDLRQTAPASLPTSGSSSVQTVEVGSRTFEAVIHYCQKSQFCSSASRHVAVEVSFGGNTIYTVESVFTSLR